MTKLLTTMVRSRDNALVDDEPFVNVLDDLRSDLEDVVENLISYIRSWRDVDMDDEDLVSIHSVVAHLPIVDVFSRSTQVVNRLSNNLVPDHEQLEIGPFVN
jgi:hypothetical protein